MLSVFKHLSQLARAISRTSNVSVAFASCNMRYFPNAHSSLDSVSSLNPSLVSARIREYVRCILANVKPDEHSAEGGLYVGSAGIAYMLYHLSKHEGFEESLATAAAYLRPAVWRSGGVDSDETSFLLGEAGAQALAAAVHHRLGDARAVGEHLRRYRALQPRYLEPTFLACGGDEYFVGRAGYVAGALWLGRELGAPALVEADLHTVCAAIVRSGREFSRRHRSPSPLMFAYYRTQYLGAAHGLSFILQMLITVPGYLASSPDAATDIKTSIDYLLSLQTEDGNWPCATDEIGQAEHELVHWCHGAPGIVYLMARAYLVYGEHKYLNSCVKAGSLVWCKGLLRKGPGICHGVAGNAYVFLLLYRLTKEDEYLHAAYAFADFLSSPEFRSEATVPDRPFSLYEGVAGTVCFLIDLLNPHKAEFPFQDVFTM